MADSFEAGSGSRSGEAVPAVPSSAAEVSIRTMQSDLEMMGKSGGMGNMNANMAQVMRVQTPQVESQPMSPLGVPEVQETPPNNYSWSKPIIWTLVIILFAAALFALGFYVIPSFLK